MTFLPQSLSARPALLAVILAFPLSLLGGTLIGALLEAGSRLV